jgi:predicted CxxxxCH...CXXCH cytochrome family protein
LHASTATLDYIANGGSSGCTQCHGSDLSGGISNVSCFGNPAGCHHSPVSGWVAAPPAAQQHGLSAKKAPGCSGFASCQICHGNNFSGGGAKESCFTCHGVNAPHPAQPWRGSPYTHTNVDTANVPVCAQCHYPGSPNNPANHPITPAPAGTPPGCYNNTLCHGENPVPHPVGSAWVATPPAAQPHGNGAKAAPGSTTGFSYCQTCHGTGTNFSGGSSGKSCYPCHVPTANSPHASQWRTGDTYVHTATATGNAPVCAFCHLNGANSPLPSPPTPAPGAQPDCFNNTLCHGAGGAPHPVPYNDNSHYTVTSATFPGSCSACHDVSAPSTKVGPVCQTCHVAASPLAALNCTSCHASPPNGGAPAGAVYANIAGAHAAHIALNSTGSPVSCNTCHSGLGSRTTAHYDNAKSRVPPGNVAFLATYNAKTGASSFLAGALSCANVSCHGGTSPPWQNVTIDVNTACTICHSQGTAQYNSYNSGKHGINSAHSNCTNCHNTTTLAVNHFTTLSTTAMEGPASATIGGGTTSIAAGNYVAATRSCAPTCHSQETW